MLKAVTYCERCGDRVALHRGDPSSGAKVGDFAYCPACFPPLNLDAPVLSDSLPREAAMSGIWMRFLSLVVAAIGGFLAR